VFHQGMILTRTSSEANSVASALRLLNVSATAYHTTVSNDIVEQFKTASIRVLVICGKLLEGFDLRSVSVVLILRNVTSRVTFTQFIGRCVRRVSLNDPVDAVILSHYRCGLEAKFSEFDTLAESDPEDDTDILNCYQVHIFFSPYIIFHMLILIFFRI
jgi:superfamily II DNA or RNA helicase